MTERTERTERPLTQRTAFALDPAPRAAAWARAAVRQAMAHGPFADRVDDACGAVTELVTNAVLHGREPLELVLECAADRLRVEVRDTSPVSPTFSVLDPTAVTGRGLLLVSALVDHWGVEPERDGKCVWFELVSVAPAADVEADVDELLARWSDELAVDPAKECVRVVLTDLDTALAAASEAHVEGVLRELALLSGTAGSSQRLQRTAARVLGAAERFEASRAELRRQLAVATAHELRTVDIELAITRGDGELVRDYTHALETADQLCVAGDLLHEPAPPEVVATRRDYLRRMLAQLSV